MIHKEQVSAMRVDVGVAFLGTASMSMLWRANLFFNATKGARVPQQQRGQKRPPHF